MAASMTGFARVEGGDDACRWIWEARSVNGKSLDLRLRLPYGWEAMDPVCRKAVRARLARGTISISLDVKPVASAKFAHLDESLLAALVERCRAAGQEPRMDVLLNVRGVLDSSEGDDGPLHGSPERQAAIALDFETLIGELIAARAEEGARIQQSVLTHVQDIEALVAEAQGSADTVPEAIRARFQAQVMALSAEGAPISEERLAQEITILAVKADIREELDRLVAHVAAARDLLSSDKPVGRKLDFLCQEFNREANTLASKAGTLTLTRIGLDLKTVIDRLREQVQNLE